MLKITRADFLKIHPDYRGKIDADDSPNLAAHAGKWGALSGSLGLPLGFLAIEGRDFEIIDPTPRPKRARRAAPAP